MITTTNIRLALAILALTFLTGCASPKFIPDVDKLALETKPNEQLNEEMFIGQWDLDGEKINTANGAPGVEAQLHELEFEAFGYDQASCAIPLCQAGNALQ